MSGGVIVSGNWGKALWPGVNAFWGKYYNEHDVEWKVLFEQLKSRKQFEEDVGTVGLGLAAVKAEGKPVSYDNDFQSFLTRYTHVEYALGFMITRIMMEDDLYDVAAEKRTKSLAFSMRQTKEIIAANVFNRAFNSSYVGGDGVSLLNATHPNKSGGTWSNTLAVAADLSEAALEQAVIDIGKYRNDRGLRIRVTPQSLHIPVDLQFEAERILMTPNRVGTANNDINALNAMSKFPKGVHVNHYFEDTDAWFLLTDCPDGMKYWERRGMEFTMDNDFDTDNAKFKATERYSFGWTDPRAAYGSPGA